jgi:hypothetical protein
MRFISVNACGALIALGLLSGCLQSSLVVDQKLPPKTALGLTDLPTSLKDKIVTTQVNKAVSFTLEMISIPSGNIQTSFSPSDMTVHKWNAVATDGQTRAGVLQIDNPATGAFTFTPALGFRGYVQTPAYIQVTGRNGMTTVQIGITVQNALQLTKPALAVRATGCLLCHANLAGNLYTDYGYGGDGKGKDYFFGVNSSALGLASSDVSNAYGDHARAAQSMIMKAYDTSAKEGIAPEVHVPIAPLTPGIQAALLPTLTTSNPAGWGGIAFTAQQAQNAVQSLASYLKAALSENSANSIVKVIEHKKVWIGAPTRQDILDAGRFSDPQGGQIIVPDKIRYFKDDPAYMTFDLSSFTFDAGTGVFRMKSGKELVCDGDLIVDGVVYLDNLKLNSLPGCRIYATGSIIVDGPITYTGNLRTPNIQLISARSVIFGVAATDSSGVDTRISNDTASRINSGMSRYLRNHADSASLEAEYAAIYQELSSISGRVDAALQPCGRSVSFKGVLANAPIVQSRYNGNFGGTIIAEFMMGSLGSFVYTYDDVFEKVPVAPLIDFSKSFDVE